MPQLVFQIENTSFLGSIPPEHSCPKQHALTLTPIPVANIDIINFNSLKDIAIFIILYCYMCQKTSLDYTNQHLISFNSTVVWLAT